MKTTTVWKSRVANLYARVADTALGSQAQWQHRLLPLYGSLHREQLVKRVQKERRRLAIRYSLCAAMAAAVLVSCVASKISGLAEVGALENDLSGKQLCLSYGKVQQRILLSQKTPETPPLSAGEKRRLLEEGQAEISREMLGNNRSLQEISGPLSLPQRLSSGVNIDYHSSDSKRISKEGLVNGIGAGAGIPVTVTARLSFGEQQSSLSFNCIVVPPQTEEEAQQALKLLAQTLEASLKQEENGMQEIHKAMEEGVSVSAYEAKTSDTALALLAAAAAFAAAFSGRFRVVSREEKEARKQILQQLPVFMDQVILMMNAGLILSEALPMAAAAFQSDAQDEGRLFRDVRLLCAKAEETCQPPAALFCSYAAQTGIGELLRFAAMLSDHIDRGSASLLQQLNMERSYMIESQWKQKEARCRELEVKLAGPLFLLLSVLLMLSAGPVLAGW